MGEARATVRRERLSVRVPGLVKDGVRARVTQLGARGLRTSESELVELLVVDGLRADLDALEGRLRHWRAGQAAR